MIENLGKQEEVITLCRNITPGFSRHFFRLRHADKKRSRMRFSMREKKEQCFATTSKKIWIWRKNRLKEDS
jgi:hypothetical protein